MERFKGACTDWTSYLEIKRPNCLILGGFAEKQGANRFGRLILTNRKEPNYFRFADHPRIGSKLDLSAESPAKSRSKSEGLIQCRLATTKTTSLRDCTFSYEWQKFST
jgi:hypothetical protein